MAYSWMGWPANPVATDVLYAALPAVSGQKVSFDATDGGGRTYTCAKASVSFAAGSYYQSTLKMREYVDMGNGLKWATCNVGASAPDAYGDYFAWGETASKAEYKDDWSNYFDTTDGGSTFTKYNLSGGKTVLAPEDDAARQIWGGTWRIPTDEEWTWLKNNCTWGYGFNGILVTSNVSGFTDKSILLPAAGYRDGAKLSDAGSGGHYWSSSLDGSDSAFARDMYFSTGPIRRFDLRYYGMSIRPLTE